eukprot:scaffold48_cov311-Pinguiococcus_pyrenoidosus.AAC.280
MTARYESECVHRETPFSQRVRRVRNKSQSFQAARGAPETPSCQRSAQVVPCRTPASSWTTCRANADRNRGAHSADGRAPSAPNSNFKRRLFGSRHP